MQITITKPDDWHLHLRDGEYLEHLLLPTIQRFCRAIIMPNLSPPITTTEKAKAYKQRILLALEKIILKYPQYSSLASFQPLMTLYLNENVTRKEIINAKHSEMIYGIKLYPAGATTNSEMGVRDLKSYYPIFEEMERQSLPLLIHAEVTDSTIDVFDKERVFIECYLHSLVTNFPQLKIVIEHLSTSFAVDFVKNSGPNIAGTITPHHLFWNRNALFQNGIRPHHYCLPLLKKEKDRLALVNAATSGSLKFFLGTDSAPHMRNKKENSCGCAGIYNSPIALELYTQIFEENEALHHLEKFSSLNGPAFYGLSSNKEKITLVKEDFFVPEAYRINSQENSQEEIIPMLSNEVVHWKLQNDGT